ncbi:MAG TPA: two-component regulator propeller domain-containing protein [Bacteroidales bacterium]|nr:two-component regulator propeller domain-containing protein [Bacteroidales bacterium]
MASMIRIIALICLCGCISASVDVSSQTLSSPDQEIISNISNHIPIENQNWGISQDHRSGYIYFANSEGLIEFNGISRKIYNLPYRQPVRSVYVSGDGTVFTGAFEEFGYWSRDNEGELVYHSLSEMSGVEKNDEIWKIYEAGGVIFFQSFTTIYRFDRNSVKAIMAPFTMLFMFPAGERFIVQVFNKGLYWFDGNNFGFIEGSELFSSVKVHAIVRTSENKYWICTSNDGIFDFDGSKITPQVSEISSYLKSQTCNAGLSLNDSLMVFGTIQNGVVICRNNGKILGKFNFANGLNNNTVLALFLDKNKGLWIGLDEGVNYYNLFPLYTVYTNSSGTLGTIYSVIREKERLYLGTNHGLFVASIQSANEVYAFSDVKLIPGTQGQVWTLEKSGNQIICGNNDGTFLVDGDKVHKISDVTGGWTIKEYNDLLIEGTYTGIVFFRKGGDGKWTFRNKIIGFDEPTRHIEIDYRGYIWAAHPRKGIYRIELNENLDSVTGKQFFNTVSGIKKKLEIHKLNNQIIFTGADSVYEYDYEHGKIIPSVKLNATLGKYREAFQIVPYTKNTYWFVGENKIALFDISKDLSAVKKLELAQKYTHLVERELQIMQISENCILIPTRQAFIICNLSALNSPVSSSDLIISRLVFEGNRKKTDFTAMEDSPIKVPYNSNNLTVYFANPGQYNLQDKEFEYRIAEIDDDWHRTTLDHFSYLNLNYGTYTLYIRSDITNDTDSQVFTVEKPWYLKWYSLTGYFLIIAGSVFLIIRIFRAELRKQKQLIEFKTSQSRLENELDYKSYELMLTMRYLIQKNDILTQLKDHVESIKESSSKYPIKSMRNIDQIINEGLKSQTEEWRDAMNTLKLSQQGFFLKLKELHPDLTPHDLRVCSYLRMNFTTKEIAKLLNITTRGVEISRYRLRKKMGLGHDTNLTEYLINLVF